jgi:hypothetical protein
MTQTLCSKSLDPPRLGMDHRNSHMDDAAVIFDLQKKIGLLMIMKYIDRNKIPSPEGATHRSFE